MYDEIFNHQKNNIQISLKFRNKFPVLFPFYFIALIVIFLIHLVYKRFSNSNNIIINIPFFCFSDNHKLIAKNFENHFQIIEYLFSSFKVKYHKKFIHLFIMGVKYGVSFSILTKLIKGKNFKFILINWYRILNLVYIEQILILTKQKYKTIVIANDHSIYNNFIIIWSKLNGLKTAYIQHAPVSEKFPPLKCDFNALFSKSALDFYKKKPFDNKILTKVFCDLRLVKFLNLKSPLKKNTILICTNKLDKLERVKEYIDFLLTKNYIITIRKHPSDYRNWRLKGVNISNNNLKQDFINNKYVLCNETALILEGIVAKKLIYKCDFSETIDNYHFSRRGLIIKEYNSIKRLYHDMENQIITYDLKNLNYFTGDIRKSKEYIKDIKDIIINLS